MRWQADFTLGALTFVLIVKFCLRVEQQPFLTRQTDKENKGRFALGETKV